MYGLIIKDCCTLLKQMKIMLIILLIWACIPGFSFASFAVFYSSMLPVTALAYDERSKWDELAVMMPYSPRDIVLSKYILGIICVSVAALIAGIAQGVVGLISKTAAESSGFIGLVLIACISLVILSINMPLMFRFGVEKGRIAFMLLICGGVVFGMAFQETMLKALDGFGNTATVVLGIVLIALVAVFVSVKISVAMYTKVRR